MLTNHRIGRITTALIAAAIVSVCGSATALAQTGGSGAPPAPAPTPTTPAPTSGVPGKATLLPDGSAVPPAGAPPAVVSAIGAANAIRFKPYVYGGGHKSFKSKGYDCSGAVSYALRGAGLLTAPMPSGPMMRWGLPGPGAWITVYAKPSHAYMVIAGLRFDTSMGGDPVNTGQGPRWRSTNRPARGYRARHVLGL